MKGAERTVISVTDRGHLATLDDQTETFTVRQWPAHLSVNQQLQLDVDVDVEMIYELRHCLYARLASKILIGDMSPYSGCTVASGVVVVVVGVCNRSQMRTGKCTCLIFGVSIGLDPG